MVTVAQVPNPIKVGPIKAPLWGLFLSVEVSEI